MDTTDISVDKARIDELEQTIAMLRKELEQHAPYLDNIHAHVLAAVDSDAYKKAESRVKKASERHAELFAAHARIVEEAKADDGSGGFNKAAWDKSLEQEKELWDDLRDAGRECTAAAHARKAARAEADEKIHKIIAPADPIGSELNIDLRPSHQAHVEELLTGLKWMQKVMSAKHGRHLVACDAPDAALQTGGRAYANGMQIALNHDDRAWVTVHELGHTIEHANANRLGNKSQAFLIDRVKSHPVEFLGAGHEPEEVATKDGFQEAYTGKYYPRSGGSTEVFSMGIQHMYQDPLKFALSDPDHFKYTLAIMHGLL